MKYSTVLLAAFAAGAMARAIPDGEYDPAGDEIRNTPGGADTSYDVSKDTYDENNKKDVDYGKKKDDDSYGKDKDGKDKDSYGKDKDSDKKDKDSYGKDKKDKDGKDRDSYGKDKKDRDHDSYKPVEQESYEHRKDREGDHYKTYFPEPKHDDKYKEKSCYDDFKWPKVVRRDEPCKIEWKPKRDHVKKTNVYLYRCDKYDAPVKKICDRCEGHSYDGWKPEDECDASDVKHGSTYRFKFCDADDEDNYTWGSEFPIYGNKVYYEKPENKKVEGQCAPEPEPEYPTPAPAPSYPAPAPAPAPEAPAPAPVAPEAPEEAPAAEAPSYPAPVAEGTAPEALVSNQTSPEVFASGSSSIFQVSMSVILGVAALVTFAL